MLRVLLPRTRSKFEPFAIERHLPSRANPSVRLQIAQVPGKRHISNDAGPVNTIFFSLQRNLGTLLRRRTNCVLFCRFSSSDHPNRAQPVYYHQLSVAHQTSLRSPTTMMSIRTPHA